MESKVEQLEAQSEAAYELTEAGADHDLTTQFRALEAGAGVDDELAAMKAKMLGPASSGGDEASKQLTEGADAPASEVDDELAKMKAQLLNS